MIYVKTKGKIKEIRFKSFMNKENFISTVNRLKSIPNSQFNDGTDKYWIIPSDYDLNLKFLKDEIVSEDIVVNAKVFDHSEIVINDEYLNELALRPYPFQIAGISFLYNHNKAIICDEMGLGKSLQLLAAAYQKYRDGVINKCLVVVPAPLKFMWDSEISKFLLRAPIQVIDGTEKQRRKQYDRVNGGPCLYTIISYETLRNDIDTVKDMHWDAILMDEAHRAGNHTTELYKALKKLKSNIWWLATGTPLQNSPDEIYYIFALLGLDLFGGYWAFRKKYYILEDQFGQKNVPIGTKNLHELHAIISPYILRRLKKDVAPDLPEIIYVNRMVAMPNNALDVYNRLLEDRLELIKEISEYTVRNELGVIVEQHPKSSILLGYLIMMQEVADTPKLLDMSESKMALSYSIKCTGKVPKIEEIKEILSSLEPDVKVVIFTQFERMQRLIVEALGKCVVVNGSCSAEEKMKRVKEFQIDDTQALVTTDCLNYGISIPEASVLINVDLPWTSAKYEQRCARIHRLNSVHEHITIVNLISQGSFDERVYSIITSKKDLSNQIVENTQLENEELLLIMDKILNADEE